MGHVVLGGGPALLAGDGPVGDPVGQPGDREEDEERLHGGTLERFLTRAG